MIKAFVFLPCKNADQAWYLICTLNYIWYLILLKIINNHFQQRSSNETIFHARPWQVKHP